MLRSLLELASPGCRVLAVPSAEEALLELGQTEIDLVICDLRLPGMDGIAFVRRARQRQPDTPLIMMSAYASEERTREADGLGVAHFFAKPLDMDALLAMVQDVLQVEPAAVLPPQVNLPTAVSPTNALRTQLNAQGVALLHHGRLQSTAGALTEAMIPTSLRTPPPATTVRMALTEEDESWGVTAVDPDTLLLVRNPAPGVNHRTLVAALRSAAATIAARPATPAPEPKPDPKPAPAAKPADALPADPELDALFATATPLPDTDDFWQTILTTSDDTPTHTGLTLDEAKARGLLPEDWEKRRLGDGETGRQGD